MNKSRTEDVLREFGLPLGGGILVVILTFFFLIPKVKEINSLRTDIAQQKQEINLLSQKIADLKTLSEVDLQESVDLVKEALPPEKDPFKSLAMAKKIFQDSGVAIESFKFITSVSSGSAQKKVDLSPLTISVSFFATFENFKQMIKEVEKILPLVKVEGLKFGSLEATASASLPNFSGKISIASFFVPFPKEMGKIEEPVPKISNQDKKFIEELKSFARYQPEVSNELAFPAGPAGKENPFPF